MTRLTSFSLFACLSMTALACGSSTSDGSGASKAGWDQARIGDTGTNWSVNAQKGAYFFFIKFSPSYNDTATVHTVRDMAVSFAQTVAGKLTSGSPAPKTLIPTLTEMPGGSGWTLDPNQPETMNGPALASNETDATILVDGGAGPYFVAGGYSAVGLAWERWVKGDNLVDLQAWQMASKTDATQLYSDLLKNPLYSNVPWVTCSGTDATNPCPLPLK